jgi:hypothetical protein
VLRHLLQREVRPGGQRLEGQRIDAVGADDFKGCGAETRAGCTSGRTGQGNSPSGEGRLAHPWLENKTVFGNARKFCFMHNFMRNFHNGQVYVYV